MPVAEGKPAQEDVSVMHTPETLRVARVPARRIRQQVHVRKKRVWIWGAIALGILAAAFLAYSQFWMTRLQTVAVEISMRAPVTGVLAVNGQIEAITIVIGVASAMVLSTCRRRPEIGIMRAMGAGQGFVIFVFVTQGASIGFMGGVSSATPGYPALLPFPSREAFKVGPLPMDITQGSYGLAILLTVIGAVGASIQPPRAAARVDPVTAIGQ